MILLEYLSFLNYKLSVFNKFIILDVSIIDKLINCMYSASTEEISNLLSYIELLPNKDVIKKDIFNFIVNMELRLSDLINNKKPELIKFCKVCGVHANILHNYDNLIKLKNVLKNIK